MIHWLAFITGFILKSLIDEILLREDVIDGVKCYVIQAIYEKLGREVELWIGKDDFLLRKFKRKLFSGAISEEIHKNIEFYEFEKLIKSVGIKCICKENIRYTESASRIAFGQYKGMFFSDLDDSYLLWLKSNYRGEQKELIDTEVLSRRL